jgi:tetratricopeptide (TPR) repeat protein
MDASENTEARKEQQERIQNVERYLAANPDWRNDAWIHRAQAYWETGDKKPMAALAIYNKGVAARAAGDYGEAMHLFGQAAYLDCGFPWPANNLAWTLSTCPDERLRDGRLAIVYAIMALGVFKADIPDFISTLAAAYAASGEFEKALGLCDKAASIWPSEETDRLRHAFRQGKAYVDRSRAPKEGECVSSEGCGKAKWGMNKLEVKAQFPKMVVEDNDTARVGGCVFKGFNADLVLHFHLDRLYRAVVRVAGVSMADARGLAFRTMKLEEAGVRSGNLRVACWASEETRARLEYDPQRREAVIEMASKTISAIRRVTPAVETSSIH